MQKIKLQICLDNVNLARIYDYANKNKLKNESQAINKLLNDYFVQETINKQTVDRLNNVISHKDRIIQNLEYNLKGNGGSNEE